jgi:hypothetical protein
MITIVVQNFGKRLIYAQCDGPRDFCNVPHEYVCGRLPPHYPVPATHAMYVDKTNGEWFYERVDGC